VLALFSVLHLYTFRAFLITKIQSENTKKTYTHISICFPPAKV